MAVHPIKVPRDAYAGRDARRRAKAQARNAAAEQCERFINADFPTRGARVHIYTYGLLAIELRLTTDEVRNALYDLGGHNGITINAPNPAAP